MKVFTNSGLKYVEATELKGFEWTQLEADIIGDALLDAQPSDELVVTIVDGFHASSVVVSKHAHQELHRRCKLMENDNTWKLSLEKLMNMNVGISPEETKRLYLVLKDVTGQSDPDVQLSALKSILKSRDISTGQATKILTLIPCNKSCPTSFAASKLVRRFRDVFCPSSYSAAINKMLDSSRIQEGHAHAPKFIIRGDK